MRPDPNAVSVQRSVPNARSSHALELLPCSCYLGTV
eukprot:COSAG01_NODE_48289_length_382_cov_2.346290_1_plen_35_part_01